MDKELYKILNTDDYKNERNYSVSTLHKFIKVYKERFDKIWEDEKYKWEAVKCFQENWDIDAVDFLDMLIRSFSKTDNLLAAVNYFPAGMIEEFARVQPEIVRDMFRNLYDESKDVYTRIAGFRNKSEYLLKNYSEAKSHYQTENSISVYLWLRYPDKYYIYKYGVVKKISEVLQSNYIFSKGSYESNIRNFLDLYDDICKEVQKDIELKNILMAHITDDCYSDPELRTLMMDIGFFISQYNSDKDGFIPTLEKYDPEISTEEYKRLLTDNSIIKKEWSDVLSSIYKMGGQATCLQIANQYGNTAQHYNANATNIARAIQRHTECPVYEDAKYGGYWCILFYGKIADSEEGSFVWKLREPLFDAIKQLDEEGWFDMENNHEIENNINYPLNTILYGPPGTGKTYSTVLYAVGICENKSIDELKQEKYEIVFKRYNQYIEEGRIVFTTFHQSYGYEEFIEGIKPVIDDTDDGSGDIRYNIEDGLFKKFCRQAMISSEKSNIADEYKFNKNPNVWKVSLERTGDNPTRTECLENNHIRIGWDSYGEIITDSIDFSELGGRIVLDSFINKMQIGDIVMSCYSASTVDAIGVVTGEYEWHPEYSNHKRLRNVKWLVKGINYNIVEMNGGANMTLPSVYKLKISVADVLKILAEVNTSDSKNKLLLYKKNHVFIIDEINRGNISKIFGELITLIEDTKRLGREEETEAILPYSHMSFGIPKNVYFLGTMNTADRSIALMDTALRRRFSFVEMMPDSNVLRNLGINVIEEDGVSLDVADMLDVINERIEYLYDREHTIGHAFFTALKDDKSISKLSEIFRNKVIPLLQEYFYEDYGKIQLVLGDNSKSDDKYKFILDTKVQSKQVFKGNTVDLDLPEKKYTIQNDAFDMIQSYKEIADSL